MTIACVLLVVIAILLLRIEAKIVGMSNICVDMHNMLLTKLRADNNEEPPKRPADKVKDPPFKYGYR